MKSFTKSLLTYLVIAFVAISCGGSDNPVPNSTIGKNCKLSKIIGTSSSSSSVTTFKYDNTNRLIEMLVIVDDSFYNTVEKTTYTFTYNTAGQLATRKLITPTNVSDYTFVYKSNGQIEKIKVISL
jgi:hypothetical protein